MASGGPAATGVVLSVTEGDDKPLEYPHMFRSTQLMVTTKMDLAPHVQCDVARGRVQVRAGRLHLLREVYERALPSYPALALLVRDGQWWLLLLRPERLAPRPAFPLRHRA